MKDVIAKLDSCVDFCVREIDYCNENIQAMEDKIERYKENRDYQIKHMAELRAAIGQLRAAELAKGGAQ